MPSNNKQHEMGSKSTAKRELQAGKSIRKAPGTRLGTLQDWRGADHNSAKLSGRHGHSIRDGR